MGADNIGIAYQTEVPLRSGTFFYSADNGATFVDINTSTLNSRLAIDVTLGAPAACGVATGLTATAVTTTGATISFTAPSGATSYTVTYTPAGGTATTVTPAPTASPITLTGLTPGTAYTVNITTNCAAGQTSAVATVTFTTLVSAPANDNCATASALTVTAACTPVNSTNTNSTASPATVPAATCGTAGPDVWYAITVPANGAVTVTTSASSVTTNQLTDTILQLYSGTCGALTPIGCNDDISGSDFYSTASVTGLTAGSTIYARVFGYSNATGDFAICATSPSCLPVSNVAVNNVTTTGAIISFTAPSGATSYTVTYTPAGGATTTVTPAPTASPITLTGLTAATSYTVTIATNCGTSAATAVTTTFRTLGTTYCVTGLGGSCNATTNITAVAITGTTLNATGLTCTSGGTPAQAYTSYPATGANTALLNVGTTYPITVTTATGNSVTVWVDYNRNQNYEPGEFVLLTANSTSTTVTGSIVVPANASLGTTGMRIRTRLSGNANGPSDACTSFGSGETKDFTVTLRNGTSTRNDALAATVGLFPNPAHQNFQLTVPAGSLHAATATLRNTLGQVVQSRQLNLPVSGGTAEFNVSSLAAGVYTLTLKSGNDFIVKRVVVE